MSKQSIPTSHITDQGYRVATIDVGTNTALLLVAEISQQGKVHALYDEQRFVRLGEGVDATGKIGQAAMYRLRDVLLAYRDIAHRFQVTAIIIGATSASRDAQNKEELIAFVHRETGLDYQILPGEVEAQWGFRGAVSVLEDQPSACMVIDIGGGSTEITVGETAGAITHRHSLDIGSVRLTERFFSTQPPRPVDVTEAKKYVIKAIREAEVTLDREVPFIGAAGTLVSLALVDRGISSWKELGAETVVLSVATVQAWNERLLSMTYEDVLALNADVMAGRADVFSAGVLILEAVMTYFDLPECRVIPRNLKDGLALKIAEERALHL